MKVGNTTIDGSINGNKARYINHSCDPNCWLDVVFVDGKHRACLFALKFIRSGAKLTFDYNWGKRADGASSTCYCGTKICRGSIEKNN